MHYYKTPLLYNVFKRSMDLLLAFCALILLSPLLIIISLLIKLGSPGPILYKGVRSGLKGKSFQIYKFRSMVVNAEQIGGPSTALDDPRLTGIGKFIRKYKIDELPQLINILKGEMSLVGPRPQVKKYTKLYSDEEKIILTVKPGLSDYASIKFINLDQILGNESVDEIYLREIEPAKNRLRIKYVNEASFLTDLKIIFMTLFQLMRIKKVWNIKN